MNSEKKFRIGTVAGLTGVRLLNVVFRAIRGYRDARWRGISRQPGYP